MGIATLEKQTTRADMRPLRRDNGLRLAELASILSGCPIRTAWDVVQAVPDDDALLRVAAVLCRVDGRQSTLTSQPAVAL